ncbi:tetratricopeptide repeat protein [Robiginitalea aurantiaca]|uniref:Tetratricopeptide repeat protein n=1 Tax=Robiginitalea aurantiaca TaxID=3056915 RepID=A0ABT7WEB3_9FLAO|nr:tetratricopeptide repeat protein [Robiginitalea aurantiaca]MDM9631240.1 tetratricopeptide repeat protein [Robiginitalea aurantiaca]
MKNLILVFSLFCALISFGQQEQQIDYEALEESKKLTSAADQELASDDFITAEATYRKAISKSTENPAAPYNLGNAYYENESFGEAFGSYKEAGERADEKPDRHRAYHNMGNVYMKRKEYENAVEAYKEALRNNPGDEETRYNLALAKEMLKKDQQNQDQNEDDQNEQQDQDEEKEQNQDQNQDQDQGGEEEQEDNQDPNQQDGDSEKEENKEGDGPEKEEQEQKPDPSQQDEKQSPPRPNQLSPQQIENLLEAMENEEKKVKEKIDAQKVKGPKVKKEKDW